MTGSLLIVEDDPVLLRGLSDRFRQDGFAVRVAVDGHSAVEMALDGASEPDLVVLDIMLPALDGLSVCRRLRAEGFTRGILLLTARGQEGDVVAGLDAGADDYVSKPFGLAELRARVQALLRRQRRGHVPHIAFGSCVLDVEARSLLRDGAPVPLTAQEFALLSHLAAQPGRTFTRDALLRAISRRSLLTGVRTVDRCIKNLRAKIESAPHHPRHLLTVREVGYRFEE